MCDPQMTQIKNGVVTLGEVDEVEILLRELAAKCQAKGMNVFLEGEQFAAVALEGYIWRNGKLERKREENE